MTKEPELPEHDLNQAVINAIATRIDSYDQAWDRRIEQLMVDINEMKDSFKTNLMEEYIPYILEILLLIPAKP